jgi:glucan 1,3-beta-glucosidase
MLFEGGDILPGAILIEFNLKPAHQGAVGMWDSVVRIGGAASTGPVVTDCDLCKAAFLLMHVTPFGSGYFENLWLWTADHSIDQPGNPSIATGRGLLVESSTDPTWLVGLGVEHNTLYAYNVVNAHNVFLGLAQVETPYWEPYPPAPAGWTLNSQYSDPDYSHCPADGSDPQCAMAWALRIVNGSDIFSYGFAGWVFFNGVGNAQCSNPSSATGGNCQDSLVSVEGVPENVVLYNVNVNAVKNLLTVNSVPVAPRFYNPGSWGGVVAAYLNFSGKRNA